MKVLLDENMSRRFRRLLAEHEVATGAYRGWSGVKNGRLLTRVEDAGFEVFVTADQNLRYQQNLSDRTLAIVVLSVNDFRVHRARIASISLAIENCSPGSVTFVDIG